MPSPQGLFKSNEAVRTAHCRRKKQEVEGNTVKQSKFRSRGIPPKCPILGQVSRVADSAAASAGADADELLLLWRSQFRCRDQPEALGETTLAVLQQGRLQHIAASDQTCPRPTF